MLKEIKLPEIADNVDSAVVLNIQVKEGDKIEKDDTIAEMESDKAAFDLPADVGGVVKEIKISEGDEVKVGQVVLTLETESDADDDADKTDEANMNAKDDSGSQNKENTDKTDDHEKSDKENNKKTSDKNGHDDHEPEDESDNDEDTDEANEDEDGGTKEKSGKKERDNKAKTDDEEKEDSSQSSKADSQDEPPKKPREEVPASPSVRRLAREIGVDIYQVEGTGPYNRISPDDVKAYAKDILKKAGQQSGSSTGDYQLPDFSKYGEIERKPLSRIRKRTAENMTASWQSIPHVFQFDKADITALEDFRKKYSKTVEKEGAKLTITAIALKIMAKALQAFPKFNASLDIDKDEVIYKKYYNIGVAVDTSRGLLVPVIRHVDKKSIVSLSKELGELAEKARNKKIMPDELQGGNIAISNLGGIGGTNFTPIVYRPNVAILGMSRARFEPVYHNNELSHKLMLPLSLSYDHRVIDGAEAARFLRWFCEALENPLLTMFQGGAE